MDQYSDLDINVFEYLNSRKVHFVDIFIYVKNKGTNKVSIVSEESINGKDYFEIFENENIKKSIDCFFLNFCRHVFKNHSEYKDLGNIKIEYQGVSFYMSMGTRSQSRYMFDLKLVEVELTSACKAQHEKEIIFNNLQEIIILKGKEAKKRI